MASAIVYTTLASTISDTEPNRLLNRFDGREIHPGLNLDL